MDAPKYRLLVDRHSELVQRINRIEVQVADLTRLADVHEQARRPNGLLGTGREEEEQARVMRQIVRHGQIVAQVEQESRLERAASRRRRRWGHRRRGLRRALADALGRLMLG